MIDYIVCQGNTPGELAGEVMRNAANGFTPLGGITYARWNGASGVHYEAFVQAMTRNPIPPAYIERRSHRQ